VKAHIASNDAEASHTKEALERKCQERESETTAREFRKRAAETRICRSRILGHSGAGLPLYNELHGLGRRSNDAAGTIWAAEVQRGVLTRAASKVNGYVTALYRRDNITFVAAVESDSGGVGPSRIQ
jgi:hypothetical protein